jgi:hypothetical protein
MGVIAVLNHNHTGGEKLDAIQMFIAKIHRVKSPLTTLI